MTPEQPPLRRWFDRLPPTARTMILGVVMALLAVGVKIAFDLAVRNPPGQPCARAEQCRSGLCASGGYCTVRCKDDSNCLTGYRCLEAAVTISSLEFKWAREGTPIAGNKRERLCLR